MAISFGKRYMMRHIKRISIEFSPFDKSSGSARELYRQLLSPSMGGKHPDCKIEVKVLEGPLRESPPVVRVDYINGIEDVIQCRRAPSPCADSFTRRIVAVSAPSCHSRVVGSSVPMRPPFPTAFASIT